MRGDRSTRRLSGMLVCLVGIFAITGCQQHEEEKLIYPDTSDLVGVDQSIIDRAKQGYVDEQVHLGALYYRGAGVEKNYQKARQWFLLASKQGNRAAQFNLGVIFGNGQGVPKDYEKAAYWYRKAADQGDRNAQYSIGGFYDRGLGVSQDHKVAVQWYKLAANQGLPIAEYDLGVSYFKGEGIEQDNKKAFYWFSKSAEQGFVSAMGSLSEMCQHGKGTQRDLDCAYRWLILELKIIDAHPDNPKRNEATVTEVKKRYDELSKELTKEQIEDANSWVSDWLARHN